jgi:hypothetical protein
MYFFFFFFFELEFNIPAYGEKTSTTQPTTNLYGEAPRHPVAPPASSYPTLQRFLRKDVALKPPHCKSWSRPGRKVSVG